MVRVTAGKYKGIQLKVPTTARPVTDRLKINIFDLIREHTPESTFLDLFAGTGAMGIEAISRGASSATLVEASSEAIEIIKTNVNKVDSELIKQGKAIISKQNVNNFLAKTKETFSVVFADPPFDKLNTLDLNELHNVVDSDGIVVVKYPETIAKDPKNLEKVYEKEVGMNFIVFYRPLL